MAERPGPDLPPGEGEDGKAHAANMLTLEIVFLGIVGLVVLAAFLEALSYELVSSRTPFVIMAPLFLLILIHGFRLWRVRREVDMARRLRLALAGRTAQFNKVAAMSGWMAALIAVIAALGHYAGIFLFGVWLMAVLAKERLWFALAVVGVTTALIYGIFEIGFNVELYRGLLWRWYAGYRDF